MSDATITPPHSFLACTQTLFVPSYKRGITSRILYLVYSFQEKQLRKCGPYLTTVAHNLQLWPIPYNCGPYLTNVSHTSQLWPIPHNCGP